MNSILIGLVLLGLSPGDSATISADPRCPKCGKRCDGVRVVFKEEHLRLLEDSRDDCEGFPAGETRALTVKSDKTFYTGLFWGTNLVIRRTIPADGPKGNHEPSVEAVVTSGVHAGETVFVRAEKVRGGGTFAGHLRLSEGTYSLDHYAPRRSPEEVLRAWSLLSRSVADLERTYMRLPKDRRARWRYWDRADAHVAQVAKQTGLPEAELRNLIVVGWRDRLPTRPGDESEVDRFVGRAFRLQVQKADALERAIDMRWRAIVTEVIGRR